MHLRAATCFAFVLALPAYAADPPADSAPPAAAGGIDRAEQLKAYMLAASALIGPEQRNALAMIDDEDRRSLAMTYYLRAGPSIASRWSWTSEQIRTYRQSPEFSTALAEIEKISAHFSMEIPGYVVHANTRIRSLEEQVSFWQTASSVGEAASELRRAALATLAQAPYAKDPDPASLKRFLDFLHTWRASRWPTIMAPGLSLHGRGRAFDFQILDRNGRTIADTETSTIGVVWEDQGWMDRLSHAVHGSSDKFKGPLRNPHEPWHYEYQPDP